MHAQKTGETTELYRDKNIQIKTYGKNSEVLKIKKKTDILCIFFFNEKFNFSVPPLLILIMSGCKREVLHTRKISLEENQSL